MDLYIIEGSFPLILHSYAHKHIQTFVVDVIHYNFNYLSEYSTGVIIHFFSFLIRHISDVHK